MMIYRVLDTPGSWGPRVLHPGSKTRDPECWSSAMDLRFEQCITGPTRITNIHVKKYSRYPGLINIHVKTYSRRIYGHIWTYTDILEHIRTYTDMYGHIWTYMDIYGHT